MTAHTEWVTRFDAPLGTDLQTERLRLGGKGLSLQRMTHEGYRVPPGFTIATATCQHFIRLGTWPDGLWEDIVAHVRLLEQSTGARFAQPGLSTPQPLTLAVRSGAADSMPGMLASVLHCGTSPDMVRTQPQLLTRYVAFVISLAWSQRIDLEELITAVVANASLPHDMHQVVEAIDALYASRVGEPLPSDAWDQLRLSVTRVWQSWSMEAATAYRQARQLDSAAGTAVNIQMMLTSDFSGVAASVDPTAQERDHISIEYVTGLGDRLVAGTQPPRRVRLHRVTGQIQNLPQHAQPCASELPSQKERGISAGNTDTGDPPRHLLQELHRAVLRLESGYGEPVDVEWSVANNQLWMLQCRRLQPTQRADAATHHDPAELWAAEKRRLAQAAGNSLRVWVQHPLSESLPAPTPLTWDIVRRSMSGNGGLGTLFRSLGFRPSAEVCRQGFLELIAGQVYADTHRIRGLFCTGLPWRHDPDELARDPSQVIAFPQHFDIDLADEWFLLRLPWMLFVLGRAGWKIRRAAREPEQIVARFARDVRNLNEYVCLQQSCDLTGMDGPELLGLLHARRQQVMDRFGPELLRPGLFGAMALQQLQSELSRVLDAAQAAQKVSELLSDLPVDESSDQEVLLLSLSRGKCSLAEFLERCGHRGSFEMELARPRWRENPQQVAAAARELAAGAAARSTSLASASRPAAEWAAELANQGARRVARIQSLRQRVRLLLPYREQGRHELMRGYALLRDVILQLGARLNIGQDIFFLDCRDLQHAHEQDASALSALVQQRRAIWHAGQAIRLPAVIRADRLNELTITGLQQDNSHCLPGTPVSAGVASGPIQRLDDAPPAESTPAPVLVLPTLDVSLLPRWIHAAAVIVDRGGTLSHGAMCLRQWNIPAVAIPGACQSFAAGEYVMVDGTTGRVVRLPE